MKVANYNSTGLTGVKAALAMKSISYYFVTDEQTMLTALALARTRTGRTNGWNGETNSKHHDHHCPNPYLIIKD